MEITYKDKIIKAQKGTKIKEVLKEEIETSKYNIMGALVNNEYQNIEYELKEDAHIKLLDMSDKEGMKIYRRTLIFIMGMAFSKIYPEALLTVNYQLSHSMFCEIENMEVTEEVIENVTKKMKELILAQLPIEKKVMNRKEAQEFFDKTKTIKGKLQLDLKTNKEIKMYFCQDYYNYFYGMLASNTKFLNLFEIVKYDNGFLIKYPSSKNPLEIAKDKENKKLAWSLNEYDDLHKVLGVNTVYKLNKAIEENRIKDVIMLDEALHEKKIALIADEISRRKNTKIVLIAGPSSSGKTTFAQRLGIQLKINGLKPVTISVDNYFVERKDTPKDKDGNYDFESIEAIDLNLFNDHLTKLLNGEEIEMPEFDFHVGTKRYNGKKMRLAEDEILVIEGIHCLNDKLTSQIEKDKKYKIYISALTVLNMDRYNRISTTDTRLIRRIVRDYQFRSYSAIHTLNTWHQVTDGEEKNIFPYQEEADVMFNSSLSYELAVLKQYVEPLLFAVDKNSEEYLEAKRLLKFFDYFVGIGSECVPTNSLLREFIGGGCFQV